MSQNQPLFQINEVIDGKYKIINVLGKGGYGEIYTCVEYESNDTVAVKVERADRNGNLLNEENILNDLKVCKFVPMILDSGVHSKRFNYIAMEILGTNLSEMRRRRKTQKFSILTTAMLGIQMLRSLKEVHDAGYVHRDIKPGNFVLGRNENSRCIYIIDFGLSKKHCNENGNVIPKQRVVRWVGSRRYMSLYTHLRKDQGRRDDLWSLLYVLIEFMSSTLPWANIQGEKSFEKVRDMKKAYNNEKLVRGLPKQFLQFLNYIKTLKYETKPDYSFLHNVLLDMFYKNGGTEDTPFDWENGNNDITNTDFLKLEYEKDESGSGFIKSDSEGEVTNSKKNRCQIM